MGLFRRHEPLHERLAREGGLIEPQPRAWPEVGIHGIQRPREVDAVVTADAPELEGESFRFVSLPDGSLLVEEGGDGPLEPLAAAVEQQVHAPYRARAVRRGETLWAVEATRIEVLELPDAPGGDAIDLAKTEDGDLQLSVDGQRIFGSLSDLEERGEREGYTYAVHAERLEGDLWEIRTAAL
jgi:hypothetical protein